MGTMKSWSIYMTCIKILLQLLTKKIRLVLTRSKLLVFMFEEEYINLLDINKRK